MIKDDDIKIIKKLIADETSTEYGSDNGYVRPHQHDGVDNLALNPVNFLGFPIFKVKTASVAPIDMPVDGTLRFQYDGTNLVTWFRSNKIWYQVGGGGGGTPSSPDTSVQFNNGGSFGGSSNFLFDSTNDILTLDKGTGPGDGAVISGGNSDIDLETNTSGDDFTGNVQIKTGDVPGNSVDFMNSGGIFLFSGGTEGNGATDQAFGGTIQLRAGYSSGAGVDGGGVLVMSGGTTTSGEANAVDGSIVLQAWHNFAVSSTAPGIVTIVNNQVITNVDFDSGQFSNFNFLAATVNLTGAKNTLWIKESTPPTTNDMNDLGYGVLYVESGALKYRGTAGTVTIIAPS